MTVPILDLDPQNKALLTQFQAAFTDLLSKGNFILGPTVESFENKLAEFLGVRHVIGVSSGTDALSAAMMTLGIGHGDEVITTPFTFIATASTIVRLGAVPKFIDIDPITIFWSGFNTKLFIMRSHILICMRTIVS